MPYTGENDLFGQPEERTSSNAFQQWWGNGITIPAFTHHVDPCTYSFDFPPSHAPPEHHVATQYPGLIFTYNAATSFTTGMTGFTSGDVQSNVLVSANLGIPTVNIATAITSANTNTSRFVCNYIGCNVTFARPGDLRRHHKKHLAPGHPCFVNHCDRKGNRAFYRLDKLRDHLRKKHGMIV